MFFIATRKNELIGSSRLAAVVVAQAALDYLAAKWEDWRTTEAFLKNKDFQGIMDLCGVNY